MRTWGVWAAAGLLILPGSVFAQEATKGKDHMSVIVSRRVAADFDLNADPEAEAWKAVPAVVAEKDRRGTVVAGHRTEIRSRWTTSHLYLHFRCPYVDLHLHPDPKTDVETNKLWEWDVAEVFVGADFQNIERYKEFQVSPQGEWVDLAIDLSANPPAYDWTWNSGFEAKARLDRAKKVWYGAMRIPLRAIDDREPRPGLELRINFYRIQGPPPNRTWINWQPVNDESFHTPSAFGRLRLGE
jgi:hypothetical protein